MGIAFSDAADFSNMCDLPAKISEVKHKTFIKVDEEGTEAAAATSVGIVPTSVFALLLDRPFIFAIRESTSGTILFIGRVVEPKEL